MLSKFENGILNQMKLQKINIGIIGGGIGGVAAAVALHRAGIEATVYERATEFREVGAGMMLWPNATRVLKEFGLLERVAASSGPNVSIFSFAPVRVRPLWTLRWASLRCPPYVHAARTCWMHCSRRSRLNGSASATISNPSSTERPACRANFSGSVSGGSESVEHDFVIGADGIRSRVRSQLLGAHEPIYRGYTIWRGLARLRGAVPSGTNSETWGRGKRFGILNTGGDRFTWYATANTDAGHVDSSEGRQGELLRMFAGWHEPIERLIDATDEGSILKNGAYDLAPLKRWGQGRVMLLGDAAHPCTPNLGLGGCMALEDALVLAKSFCIEASPELALRHYESLRRGRTRHVQQRSLLMGQVGQWENRLVAGGRQVVTSMLPAEIFERNLRRVYSYAT